MSNRPYCTPGPKPGSTKAISQRKAINEGYEAAPSKRVVKVQMGGARHGETKVPGLTNRK